MLAKADVVNLQPNENERVTSHSREQMIYGFPENSAHAQTVDTRLFLASILSLGMRLIATAEISDLGSHLKGTGSHFLWVMKGSHNNCYVVWE